MAKVFTVPQKPKAEPAAKALSHSPEGPGERRWGVLRERRWGVLKVAVLALEGPAYPDAYLPEGHRIIATRMEEGSIYRDHLVSGPDMPLYEEGKDLPQVFLIFDREEAGLFCSWMHLTYRRWRISEEALPC